MIHIMTIHWQDDKWVDIQLAYLRKHVAQPFKVYAFLNGLPREYRAKYFYSSTEPVREHPVKLNILADIAAFNKSGDDDLLMFIDGDAFPVGDVVSFGLEKLKAYPLVAVQRRENCDDIQPHPCFCLTTLKFWKAIDGDWKEGYEWVNSQGRSVTDVGGNLLGILREKGMDWYPMLRSNKKDLHPILFGLYEDLVYHHGAAYRKPIMRVDLDIKSAWRARLIELMPARALKKLFRPKRKAIEEKNQLLSERVFEMIKRDPEFYRYFQEP